MVKTAKLNNQSVFSCGECGLKYKDQATAEKCEAWCREHHTCNIEIIKEAIKENSDD